MLLALQSGPIDSIKTLTTVLTTQSLEQSARRGTVRATILCSASLAFAFGAVSPKGAIANHFSPPSALPTAASALAQKKKPSVSKAPKANVLVIHSYNPELSWTQQQKDGIDQGFANSQHDVTVYHEFLDAKRYPDLSHRQLFLEYLHSKYQNTPLNILMIADDPGLQLLLEVKQDYFPGLPVVFMGINNVQEELLNIPWLTGVFETHSIEDTIWIAQQQTVSQQVIVITDSSETGQANRSRLEALNEATIDRSLIFVEDVPDSKVQDILGSYPDHMPIFLGGQLRKDRPNGALIDFDQETAVLRANLPNPIYTDAKMRMGHGAVGGKVLDGSFHAEQAVQLAEQILNGTPTSSITPIVKSKNQWVFDAKELRRLNVAIADLPPNSELINHQLSFYEQNRAVVWATLGLFSIGGLIILALANAIRLQKHAEMKLKENERQLEHRVNKRTEELQATLETLKTTQARLLQTEKSSSLSRLMGGLAHEFNNPLGFIAGNIECLEGYTQNLLKLLNLYQTQTGPTTTVTQYSNEIDLSYIQEDIPKVLSSINRGTCRIQALVQTLNEFVRVNEEGFKPTDINHSLDTTLLILNAQLPSDIKVIKDYASLPLVHCNPRDLNQVLMSILLNAIEALATSETHPKNIHLTTSLLSQDWVHISISDTGPGITPEHQLKIFEPFFTTKTIGKGMGMGLALCNQTIQQHKGQLSCTSIPGVKTTFHINLPVNHEQTPGEYPDE